MRQKLSGSRGVTLVEMLCASIILILLGLILNVGIQAAMDGYRTILAESEAELLLSTAVDALAADLRYARDVRTEEKDGKTLLSGYDSSFYGKNASLSLEGGQIVAGGPGGTMRVLPPGAYGNGVYEIEEMEITYDGTCFTVHLRAAQAGGEIGAETPAEGVSIRCLNGGATGGQA